MRLSVLFLGCAFCVGTILGAQQSSRVIHSFKTPIGEIKEVEDMIRPQVYGNMYLTFNDKVILKGKSSDGILVGLMSYDCQDSPKDEGLYIRFIYREVFPAGGSAGWEKYYIVDLSGMEPVVSPGFDNGDLTYLQKAVWQKDKVTIHFKDKGKIFVWENFKLKELHRNKK